MQSQAGTAFAFDHFSLQHYIIPFSRGRQRVGMTTDIFVDTIGEGNVPWRVDGIRSQDWDEQPTEMHGETLELGVREGVVHAATLERSS